MHLFRGILKFPRRSNPLGSLRISLFLSVFNLLFLSGSVVAQVNAEIVFVTQPPFPEDFATINSTFGNQRGDLEAVPRGGDLYIRYSDGSLKNLTQSAGYGNSGFQGASSIAVRDPFPHFSGSKVIFSMLIGAPTERYQYQDYFWQIYEVSGLGKNQTPVIAKLANQPSNFNNIMPTYSSDGRIIFVSDRPRNGAAHLYPQRDEYESTDTNTGVWSLDPSNGNLRILDHAPSGDFNPFVDSFGRIIFTRWDHLQRDQQAGGLTTYEAFNYSSESEFADQTVSDAEVFPEIRDERERVREGTPAKVNLHDFNHFFPWMLNQDGTGHETVNHVGRHELHEYFNRSLNDDDNLEEFYYENVSRPNQNYIFSMHQLREDPLRAGYYYAIDAPEFSTHAAGQIVGMLAPPSKNPDDIVIDYITHRDTASYSDAPSGNHTGLYRNPLPLSDGKLVAVHTNTKDRDRNLGTRNNPVSAYDFRLKLLAQSGSYFQPSQNLTTGIVKSISYYDPDELVTYNGQFWELQPVELRSYSIPPNTAGGVEEVERVVFEEEGVVVDDFKDYLLENDLALIVVRNVTTRDDLDQQQPFNLVVPGGVQKTPRPGKQYSVLDLQIFQGDQIRGYGRNSGVWDGRRVLANLMHEGGDVAVTREDSPASSVEVAIDGSLAALVPAKRALTWQLLSPDAEPVVRERYWLTFAAGEIRTCGSCHGVNKVDQSGDVAPTNKPEALRTLLQLWKGTPRTIRPRYDLKLGSYRRSTLSNGLLVSGAKARFVLDGVNNAAKSKELSFKAKIGKQKCRGSKRIVVGESGDLSKAFRAPQISRGKLTLSLEYQGTSLGEVSARFRSARGARANLSKFDLNRACSAVMRAK